MLNRTFFILGFFMIAANATAAIAPRKAVIVQTQPQAFEPSVTLHQVRGQFHDVTEVKIQILDSSLELDLNYLGHESWEAKLSPEQVRSLLGKENSKTMNAKLVVRSKNDKQRYDTKTEEIHLIIQNSI
jgi:hypothetical protein